jgi:bacillithiol biosynthesis cysteine-adding enzyme BshC
MFQSPLPASAFRCTGAAAEERLTQVLAGNGVVVTTGQQPQLFGGPLLVLYKAFSAVAVARDIEARLGCPCLALFWVASDDHDWSEVASIDAPVGGEGPRRLSLAPPPGWEGRSVGPAPLPESVDQIVSRFTEALVPSESGAAWIAALARAYVPDRSFAEAFMEVLGGWLEAVPLAMLDSAHPEVRQASVPIFRRALDDHAAVEAALLSGSMDVSRAGYRPQLSHLPDAAPLFRSGGRGRRRLYVSEARVREAPDEFGEPLHEVSAELESEAGLYSPAAALRPPLESSLLPVVATVLGPGEIAYWAQLPALFDTLGVRMPAIRPRQAWRVVEPSTSRLLDRAGVSAEDLSDGGTAVSEALVERHRPRRVEEALLALEERVDSQFKTLEEAVQQEMPGLRSAVGKARSQAFSGLAVFRRTLDAGTRERERVKFAQVRRAADSLYPGGVPQERIVSPFAYLARYGTAFLDLLVAGASDGGSSGISGRQDSVAAPPSAE